MLGQALLNIGAISQTQLEWALAEQRRSGALLGEVLLGRSFVSEDALTRALAHEAGVRCVPRTDMQPAPVAVALVPEAFARRYHLVPLSLDGDVLSVAQANPFDVLALDDLSRIARREVVASCGTASDIRAALDDCYRPGARDVEPTRMPGHVVVSTRAQPGDLALSGLGLSRRDLASLMDLLTRPRGAVLVAGPLGSGRRTTVAAAAAQLCASGRSVRGPEAADAAEDVVVVGDIHDASIAQFALAEAASRALVMGTLRSDRGVGAVAPLMGRLVRRDVLAAGLAGVVAQRLVRLVCAACSAPHDYPESLLAQVGLTRDPGVVFVRGRGCAACDGTGYRGRTGVFEVLVIDAGMRALIRADADAHRLQEAAEAAGMRTLAEDALAKALFRMTTLEEVLGVAYA